jgi:galactonate dehydratase
LAFAPPISNDPLAIRGFHAWRLCEPVSKRRYTVVKLTAMGGITGYGEGGPCSAADLGAAHEAVAGRRATESEFIRHRLAASPVTEAAINNAMLDLVSRSKGIPIYQYLGGPTRFKVRLFAHPEGGDDAMLTASLERAKSHGMHAFSMAIPPREPMSKLQDWVDGIGRRIADMQRRGGEGSEWVFDGGAALTPADAAVLAEAFEKTHPIWLDEPIAALTTDALAKIVDGSVMPIGVGRTISDLAAFQNLLRFGSVNPAAKSRIETA